MEEVANPSLQTDIKLLNLKRSRTSKSERFLSDSATLTSSGSLKTNINKISGSGSGKSKQKQSGRRSIERLLRTYGDDVGSNSPSASRKYPLRLSKSFKTLSPTSNSESSYIYDSDSHLDRNGSGRKCVDIAKQLDLDPKELSALRNQNRPKFDAFEALSNEAAAAAASGPQNEESAYRSNPDSRGNQLRRRKSSTLSIGSFGTRNLFPLQDTRQHEQKPDYVHANKVVVDSVFRPSKAAVTSPTRFQEFQNFDGEKRIPDDRDFALEYQLAPDSRLTDISTETRGSRLRRVYNGSGAARSNGIKNGQSNSKAVVERLASPIRDTVAAQAKLGIRAIVRLDGGRKPRGIVSTLIENTRKQLSKNRALCDQAKFKVKQRKAELKQLELELECVKLDGQALGLQFVKDELVLPLEKSGLNSSSIISEDDRLVPVRSVSMRPVYSKHTPIAEMEDELEYQHALIRHVQYRGRMYQHILSRSREELLLLSRTIAQTTKEDQQTCATLTEANREYNQLHSSLVVVNAKLNEQTKNIEEEVTLWKKEIAERREWVQKKEAYDKHFESVLEKKQEMQRRKEEHEAKNGIERQLKDKLNAHHVREKIAISANEKSHRARTRAATTIPRRENDSLISPSIEQNQRKGYNNSTTTTTTQQGRTQMSTKPRASPNYFDFNNLESEDFVERVFQQIGLNLKRIDPTTAVKFCIHNYQVSTELKGKQANLTHQIDRTKRAIVACERETRALTLADGNISNRMRLNAERQLRDTEKALLAERQSCKHAQNILRPAREGLEHLCTILLGKPGKNWLEEGNVEHTLHHMNSHLVVFLNRMARERRNKKFNKLHRLHRVGSVSSSSTADEHVSGKSGADHHHDSSNMSRRGSNQPTQKQNSGEETSTQHASETVPLFKRHPSIQSDVGDILHLPALMLQSDVAESVLSPYNVRVRSKLRDREDNGTPRKIPHSTGAIGVLDTGTVVVGDSAPSDKVPATASSYSSCVEDKGFDSRDDDDWRLQRVSVKDNAARLLGVKGPSSPSSRRSVASFSSKRSRRSTSKRVAKLNRGSITKRRNGSAATVSSLKR